MKRWVTAALLSGGLVLTACTAEPASPSEPTSSAPTASDPTSAAPSTEPPGPVEPTLPPEAKDATKAGAEAFVEYFWAVVDYAQESGDVATLESLSQDACGGCKGGSDWIARVHAAGGTISGGLHTVSRITALPAPSTSDDWIITMTVRTTPQRVRGAGKENRSSDAGEGTYTMVVTPAQGRWQVADLRSM